MLLLFQLDHTNNFNFYVSLSESGWGNGQRVWDVGATSWADISTHHILKGRIAGPGWRRDGGKTTGDKEETGHLLVWCTWSGRSRRLLRDPRVHSHSGLVSPSRQVSSTTSWTSVTTCCKVWRLKLTKLREKISFSFPHQASAGFSPHWSFYINDNKSFS